MYAKLLTGTDWLVVKILRHIPLMGGLIYLGWKYISPLYPDPKEDKDALSG